MHPMAIIGTCAALLLAAGCSSNHPAPAAVSGSPSVVQSSPAASPSPSASELGVALGTAQTASSSEGVTVRTTVSQYSVVTLTGSNQETLPAGTKVALVQAQGCVTANSSGKDIVLWWKPWTLVTSTGATVQPLSVYGTADWPGSLYPNDVNTTTPTGRCRSGLIPFSLTGVSGTPVAAEYNVAGIVLDWRVS